MEQAIPSTTTTTPDAASLEKALARHLSVLYPADRIESTISKIIEIAEKYSPYNNQVVSERWSEQSTLLITYGDSIQKKDEIPLQTLRLFVNQRLIDAISIIHILPFYPYSSDDGFSVIDYRMVNPNLGHWQDVENLAEDFRLMFDLVINHVSRESLWFSDFIADLEPGRNYFIEYASDTDVSLVTRPRNSPLLVPVTSRQGTRYLWATFSEDQIDLNFANPDVLLEFIDILMGYIHKGASLIRLDAIAFLWKQLGTSCIHLRQTHEVVKLFRTLLDYYCPSAILLTETNVPHHENMSYFGQGDEAHMIYQFSLPPLVLHALNRGNARYLTEWARQLPVLPRECTYLNFTASHDGIGLRALEGVLSRNEIDDLIESMHRFGGFVSMKANPDGKDSPYEINISLYDALQGTRRGPDQWQIPRFICSQSIMLALQGIPALYIHSLLATPNDLHGVEMTGRTRSINRKRWDLDEISELLDNPSSSHYRVFNNLLERIRIRKQQHCFHPDSPQQVIEAGNGLFIILRESQQTHERILAIHNVTASPQPLSIQDRPDLTDNIQWKDLITGEEITSILPYVTLTPYQVMWLYCQRN